MLRANILYRQRERERGGDRGESEREREREREEMTRLTCSNVGIIFDLHYHVSSEYLSVPSSLLWCLQ